MKPSSQRHSVIIALFLFGLLIHSNAPTTDARPLETGQPSPLQLLFLARDSSNPWLLLLFPSLNGQFNSQATSTPLLLTSKKRTTAAYRPTPLTTPVTPTDSYQYEYCHNPDNYNFTSPGSSLLLDHIRPIARENCYFTLFDQDRPSLPDFEIYPEDNIHTVILFETHPAHGQPPFCKLITLNGHPPEGEILLNMKGNIGEKLIIEAACQAPFDFYVYYQEYPKAARDYQDKQIVYFANGGVQVLEANYWYRFKTFLQPEDYAAIFPNVYPSRVRSKDSPFELKTVRLSINKLDQKISDDLCVACEHTWLKDFKVNVKWVWPDSTTEQAFVQP